MIQYTKLVDNHGPMKYILLQPCPNQDLVFTCLQYKSLGNAVGKGEIARNECFLPVWITFHNFHRILKLSSANYFNLEEYKICSLGKV